MKFVYVLVTFCIVHLLSCSLLFAQLEACTFSDSGIEGVEVGQIGDREIYTLFTPRLMDEAAEFFSIENSYRSLLDAVGTLNELIDWYQPIIASEQSDAQKIRELVESGRIDWIGIEYLKTDTTYVDIMRESYLQYQNRINGELLNQSSDWDPNRTEQLLSLVFDAYIIVYADLDIFRKIEIYPLDIDAIDEELTLIEHFNYWNDLIAEDPFVTEAQRLEVISFIEETMETEPRLITEPEIEAFLNTLGIPERSGLNIKILMRIHNDLASLYLRIDRAAVQSILDLSGNGVILFGTDRSFSIKQGLITACLGGNGSP